jgi:hypothetical protein
LNFASVDDFADFALYLAGQLGNLPLRHSVALNNLVDLGHIPFGKGRLEFRTVPQWGEVGSPQVALPRGPSHEPSSSIPQCL